MRFVFSTILICVLFAAYVSADPNLKIYVFNVGQADAQLIVYPSGYSILIDCGEELWNSLTNCNYVAKKIKEILGTMKVNTIVVTHTHLDHIGTTDYGGIWGLVNRHGLQYDKMIDRDSGVWKDSNRNGKCERETEIQYRIIGVTSPTTDKWLCWVSSSDVKNKREIAKLCAANQMRPKDKGGKITVVGVDGLGATTKSGSPVTANWSAVSSAPSENAYSIGLLIEYNKFSYLTMGDMDGAYFSGNTYSDIESTVLGRVGPVDLYHANHHGSPFSSSKELLDKIKPTATVISVGKDNDHSHPGQETIDRLTNAKTDIFLTSKGVTRNYRSSVVANGDIVIETDGNKFMSITAGKRTKKYTSLKNTKFPSCKDGSLQDKKVPTVKK